MSVVRTEQGTMHTAGKSEGQKTVPFTDDEAQVVAAAANERATKLGIQTRYVVTAD